jgi:hypothetical protein
VRFLPSVSVLCLAALALLAPQIIRPPSLPGLQLTQEAYVWQHTHNPGVQNAISEHGSAFRQITVLAAEVSWPSRDPAAMPDITRVALKLPSPDTCPPIGLALRVHAYRGSFSADSPATRRLVALARELVSRTEAGGHRVCEFQIDFDAGESQLDAYLQWLEVLRSSLAPVPVAFTALPVWLDHAGSFRRLARASDGFVLQVHSLTLPASPDVLTPLCDPSAAMRAIRIAADCNVPFRVALSTYGYEVVFDQHRRFLGISADGSARSRPAGSICRIIRSDYAELANIVSSLQRQHPAPLTGIIWYRLPVAGERLNWPWLTLAAVMEGRVPAANLHVEGVASPTDPALIHIMLTNSGEADAFQIPVTTLNWSGANRVASDALAGFSSDTDTATSARLSPPAGFRLQPSASVSVAWLRFDHAPLSFHATFSP